MTLMKMGARAAEIETRTFLGAELSRVGLDISERSQIQMLEFLSLLERWDRTHNLTAVRGPESLVQAHLIDPLLALPHLQARIEECSVETLLDVGSGSGVPAIPWALALPGLKIQLVEKAAKKAAFLRYAASRLGLHARLLLHPVDVSTLQADATYAMITSRAFASLSRFISQTFELSAEGTLWLYMAGKLSTIEGLDVDKSEYKHPLLGGRLRLESIDYLEDPLGRSRHLIWIRRVR